METAQYGTDYKCNETHFTASVVTVSTF